MIRPNPAARAAALTVAVLSAAALAVGIGTTAMIAGAEGADAAFARATPLIVVAEILKLLTAAAEILVVRAVAGAAPAAAARRATLVSGIAGALLIAASAAVGLYAVATGEAELGPLVADIGRAGLAATGLFAFVLLSFEAPRLRRWHAGASLLFGIASMGALLWAPLASVSIVIGWAFWLGLAGRLRHR